MIRHISIPSGPVGCYAIVISRSVGSVSKVLGVIRVEHGVIVAISKDLLKYI